MEHVQVAEAADALRHQISGTLLLPGDAEYDQTRRGWNLNVDQHPALVIVVNDVADVQAAVRFARVHNLGVTVQLTGHGAKYAADDNMMIVTARMNGVSVDAVRATARVEAGAIWHQVIDAATPHGLAPLLGTSPHVGVVGYTLGGGIGWLARQYGLAADSVLAIEIVTPDGEHRHTSARENVDLFWALLGGGGNFGVVTAIEFALHPVSKLYGGALTYPGTHVADVLRFYRAWVKGVPDAMTSSLAVMKYPEVPFLPDVVRGKTMVIVRAAYVGDAAEGEQWMQPWLDWQTPLANTFRELPFAEVATITNDTQAPPPAMVFPSSEMLNELSDEAIEIITRYATNPTSPVVMSELRHAGGAIARAAPNAEQQANAVGNRDANFYLMIGGPAFTPEVRAAMEPYIRQYKEELRPHLHGGIYLNFANARETRERLQDAFTPETFARLVAIKQQVDPDNLFRYSHPLIAQ